MNIQEYIRFFHTLAEKSAEIIRPYFFNPEIRMEYKADESPVTTADREAEKALRALINRQYPRHGIMGEELGNEKEDAEFIWTLDPIDGTIAFTTGVPLFGTLVGLLHNRKPIAGMIHQPITDLTCIGTSDQTTLNGRAVTVRSVSSLEKATLLTTDIKNVHAHRNYTSFQTLIDRVNIFRTWADCYGYLLVACGYADIMVDPIMHEWDKLPLIPIIRSAGGTITGWEGGDVLQADSCVAASRTLHSRVIDMLNA